MIAQKFKTSEPKVIDATYNDFKRLMPRDAAPSPDGAKNVLAQLDRRSASRSAARTSMTISISASSQKLKQDGFFAELEKTYPIK